MRQLFRIASYVLVNAAVVFGLLEGALRVRPELIPLEVLVGFQPTIRNEIAVRRGLPRLASTQPVARDDGGPWLAVFGPSTVVGFPGSEAQGARSEVTVDARGFCNATKDAARSHSDVVVIGDSFTFCTAVAPHEAWAAQLARRTGKTTYNLGRMGIGIHEYVQLLKHFGLALTPRTVIMNVYEGNDLRDAQRFVEASRKAGKKKAADVHDPESRWLNRSYAVATLASLSGHVYDHDQEHEGKANRFMRKLRWWYRYSDYEYALKFPDGKVAFNRTGADAEEPLFARALSDDRIDRDVWRAMRSGLESFVALAEQHEFQPVVSYTPSAYTVYQPVVEFQDATLRPVMQHFSEVQRQFYASQAQRLGYRFVDLTPLLQSQAAKLGKSPLLYRPDDLHLTQEGHAAIAHALAAQISTP